jgi:hypothetical protein
MGWGFIGAPVSLEINKMCAKSYSIVIIYISIE